MIPKKEDLLKRYREMDREVFQDLVTSKVLGEKFVDVLSREIGKHVNFVGIVMISTVACHAPGVQTNIEGMIFPAVEFNVPRDEYKLLRKKYESETFTIYWRGRRIKVELLKSQ